MPAVNTDDTLPAAAHASSKRTPVVKPTVRGEFGRRDMMHRLCRCLAWFCDLPALVHRRRRNSGGQRSLVPSPLSRTPHVRFDPRCVCARARRLAPDEDRLGRPQAPRRRGCRSAENAYDQHDDAEPARGERRGLLPNIHCARHGADAQPSASSSQDARLRRSP